MGDTEWKAHKPDSKEKPFQDNEEKTSSDISVNNSDPGELFVLCFNYKSPVESLKYNFHM